MFTKEEATQERVDVYVAALEAEKESVAVRIKNAKAGLPDPVNASLKALEARAKSIDAEIKRAKGVDPADEESAEA